MAQHFEEYTLYRYVGSIENAPKGFTKTPRLVEYLNYLSQQQDKRVFTVVCTSDQMWYQIITVRETN